MAAFGPPLVDTFGMFSSVGNTLAGGLQAYGQRKGVELASQKWEEREQREANRGAQLQQAMQGPPGAPMNLNYGAAIQQAAGMGSTPRPSSGAGGNQPRGIRNNNPGNIEAGGFTKGLPGFQGSDGRFARFETPEQGINAASRLLESYGKRGFTTTAAIVNRWAPPSDNNPTGRYVQHVANKLGVDPNAPLDLSNPDVRAKIIEAKIEFENGRNPYGTDVIRRGVGYAAAPAMGGGAAVLSGGAGNDRLDGGAGQDTLARAPMGRGDIARMQQERLQAQAQAQAAQAAPAAPQDDARRQQALAMLEAERARSNPNFAAQRNQIVNAGPTQAEAPAPMNPEAAFLGAQAPTPGPVLPVRATTAYQNDLAIDQGQGGPMGGPMDGRRQLLQMARDNEGLETVGADTQAALARMQAGQGAPGAVPDAAAMQPGSDGSPPADMPVPGAAPAMGQGFAPPPQQQGPRPFGSAPGDGELLALMMQLDAYRPVAQAIMKARTNPDSPYEFQRIGNQLVAINRNTLDYRPIATLPTESKREFTQIGEDANGAKLYGFVDPISGTVTPVEGIGGAGGAPQQGNPYSAGKFTESEGKAATFADRMAGAENVIRQVETLETGTTARLGRYMPGELKSGQRLQLEQAQRDFVNAALRQESGAAIAESEFENARLQYFPQPGDTPQVVEQKRQNRQRTIEGFARQAGRSYRPNWSLNPPGQPQAPGAPGQPVRVTSPDQLAALPSGATFIAPDGTLRRKR